MNREQKTKQADTSDDIYEVPLDRTPLRLNKLHPSSDRRPWTGRKRGADAPIHPSSETERDKLSAPDHQCGPCGRRQGARIRPCGYTFLNEA